MNISQTLITILAVIGIVVVCLLAIVPTAMEIPRPTRAGWIDQPDLRPNSDSTAARKPSTSSVSVSKEHTQRTSPLVGSQS